MTSVNKPKIAIIHNSLWSMRGAERVLEFLCEKYPDSEIYTLFGGLDSISKTITSHKIHFSFLQNLPFIKSLYRLTLPLWPLAIEQFDLSKYYLVISISSSVSKGVITGPDQKHISYILTPMRFIWDQKNEYQSKFNFFQKLFSIQTFHFLRVWDTASSRRPDINIAISNLVAKRLYKYNKIEVDDVIYPPTELRTPNPDLEREDWYLAISPYSENKGGEYIEHFAKLGNKIKVTGAIQPPVNPDIEYLGWVDDEEKWDLYRKCKALLYFGIEDFGMVPLEALSVGTSVIARKGSGFLELVSGSGFTIPGLESLDLVYIESTGLDSLKDKLDGSRLISLIDAELQRIISK